MNVAGAECRECLQVQRCRITLVLGKAVTGIGGLHSLHLSITRYLGEYRGCGDAIHFGIAFDYCRTRVIPARAIQSVYIDETGLHGQCFRSPRHC